MRACCMPLQFVALFLGTTIAGSVLSELQVWGCGR